MSAATSEAVRVSRPQLVQFFSEMGHPAEKVKNWTEARMKHRIANLEKDIADKKAHKPKSDEGKSLFDALVGSNGSTEIIWSDATEEAPVILPPDVKTATEEADQTFTVPIRSIVGDTDVRNPLSPSLKKQGWAFMDGDKNVWQLAVSETPEARQQFRELIEAECPDIVSFADNLEKVGQLHAIRLIETEKGTYDFVYGRSRCLALLYSWIRAGSQGEPTVNAVIVKANAVDRVLQALSENDDTYRKAPTAYEVAETIAHLHKEQKVKLKEIANRYGRTEQWVRDQLALAGIGQSAKKEVVQGKVKKSAAIAKARKEEKEAKIKDKIAKAKKDGKDDVVNELKAKLEKVHAEPIQMRSRAECIAARDEVAPTKKLSAEEFFDWLFCKSRKLV